MEKISRNIIAFTVAVCLLGLFWFLNDLSPNHGLWRATGDTALVLLSFSLLAGPIQKLIPRWVGLQPYKKLFGVWFYVLGIFHLVWLMQFFFHWSFIGIFGLAREKVGLVFTLPNIGFANLLGFTALVLGTLLAVTSFEAILRYFGGSAWKWLHRFAYVIFYLSAAHGIYFIIFHGRKPVPFSDPILISLIILVIILQFIGFIKTVMEYRNKQKKITNGT